MSRLKIFRFNDSKALSNNSTDCVLIDLENTHSILLKPRVAASFFYSKLTQGAAKRLKISLYGEKCFTLTMESSLKSKKRSP